MAASQKKVYNVAVLLFTGADILDFAGPLEILFHTMYNTDISNPEPVFKPTTIARYVSLRKGFSATNPMSLPSCVSVFQVHLSRFYSWSYKECTPIPESA